MKKMRASIVVLLTLVMILSIQPANASAAADLTLPAQEVGYNPENAKGTIMLGNLFFSGLPTSLVFTRLELWGDNADAFRLSRTSFSISDGFHTSYPIDIWPVEGLAPGTYTVNVRSVYDPWGPVVETTGNVSVSFTVLPIPTYTVTFLDFDDTVLKTQYVTRGSDATSPAVPPRAGYAFNGWSASFGNVKGDLIVKALYTINQYDVTFVDWDDTVLSKQSVAYLSAASAPSVPIRYAYTFTGWDADFSRITDHLTVKAQYALNQYGVTFVDWDGTVLKKQTVEHGADASAPADPTREGYTFTGWSADFTGITGALTVTALYEINQYEVTFVDWNGDVLKKQTVEHFAAASAPTEPKREGYTFIGWSADFSYITGALTVSAQYEINRYAVRFVDWDGFLLKEQTVEHFASATAPADPQRADWVFIGWDKDFSFITGELTVTAQYKRAEVSASVEKISGNQNELTITIHEFYSDGSSKDIPYKMMIRNNAEGTYSAGEYIVYVNTKGNVQIRDCYIVERVLN